jgi:RHS repeat-associated protein
VETEAGIATIEMGARPYVGGLARFTQPDPVEGGSDNDYEYATGDPINSSDLDGQRCLTVLRDERGCAKKRVLGSGKPKPYGTVEVWPEKRGVWPRRLLAATAGSSVRPKGSLAG